MSVADLQGRPAMPGEIEELERLAVAREAKSWCGTPWVHRSCVKGGGVDCAHLLIGIYRNAGIVSGKIEVPEYRQDWAIHNCEEVFRNIVERYCRPLSPGTKPRMGDVVLFKYGQAASHAAIVIAWPEIVHAYMRRKKVLVDDAEKNSDLASKEISAWSPWPRAHTSSLRGD